MHFRLVKPVKRTGSINHQFLQRIPADVKPRAVGVRLDIPVGPDTVAKRISAKDDAIRLSLRTAVPAEVKTRQAQVVAYLETVWQALRAAEPVALDYRQATALAKELYEGWAKETEREYGADWHSTARDGTLVGREQVPFEHSLVPGPQPDSWAALAARLAEDPAADPEPVVGALVSARLLKWGIAKLDAASRAIVMRAFTEALRDAVALRQRQAGGDYSPDPKANRFPEWTPPQPITAAKPAAAVSLTGLVEDWWREAKPAGRSFSTYESYKGKVARFAAFLKHDDAARVMASDVVAYKDFRLAEGVNPKTVGDGDVACLRTLFKWAIGNKKLTTNPAEDVRVVRSKPTRTRGKEFTKEEATAILAHSVNHKGRETPKLKMAKRWVPWVCAYTGARVGEIVQLRKEDIRQEGSVWIMTITPDAGTVKDKEVREVVLHDHLIAQGFIAFVTSAPAGYLFLTPRKKDGEVRGVWRSGKNRVREFIREAVKDDRVQPNHAWRHTFKTVGREAGIEDSVLDAICGHAAKTVGGAYGSVTLKAQADAMGKFPRFNTETPPPSGE